MGGAGTEGGRACQPYMCGRGECGTFRAVTDPDLDFGPEEEDLEAPREIDHEGVEDTVAARCEQMGKEASLTPGRCAVDMYMQGSLVEHLGGNQ